MPKRGKTASSIPPRDFTFVDVFAGCGGLSLGLMQAGWNGVFAIERDQNAFATLSTNLTNLNPHSRHKFEWPDELPLKPLDIDDVLGQYRTAVGQQADRIDMPAGGPPCQGFSAAGRRDPNDPRNRLVRSYLQLVDLLRPRIVLIENVRGITADFVEGENRQRTRNYAAWLKNSLADDYEVFTKIIDTSMFGVPQRRHRFFIIALRHGAFDTQLCPFDCVESGRLRFLERKAIRTTPVSARLAISDLEVSSNGTVPSRDTSGFEEIRYKSPKTSYQRLMNDGVGSNIADRPVLTSKCSRLVFMDYASLYSCRDVSPIMPSGDCRNNSAVQTDGRRLRRGRCISCRLCEHCGRWIRRTFAPRIAHERFVEQAALPLSIVSCDTSASSSASSRCMAVLSPLQNI